MDLYVNGFSADNSYASPLTSGSKDKAKSAQNPKKNKQTISEREGNYYYTYLVDNEKGTKILLSKIPIEQADKLKLSKQSLEFATTKSCSYTALSNDCTSHDCKQQMQLQATHRKNIQEALNVMKKKS